MTDTPDMEQQIDNVPLLKPIKEKKPRSEKQLKSFAACSERLKERHRVQLHDKKVKAAKFLLDHEKNKEERREGLIIFFYFKFSKNFFYNLPFFENISENRKLLFIILFYNLSFFEEISENRKLLFIILFENSYLIFYFFI